MSTQVVKVFVPPVAATPRGARWASDLTIWLARAGRRVWLGLEDIGRARAARELRRLVERHAHQPELAQSLRDAMHRSAMHRDSQH